MESKVQNAKKNADIAEENDGVTAEKIKFPLYVFPETMKTVDILYKSDNCSSRTEFMEKAIRFYCGYLLQNKPFYVNALAYTGQNCLQEYVFHYLSEMFGQRLLSLVPSATERDCQFTGNFLSGAMVGLLLPWVRNGMPPLNQADLDHGLRTLCSCNLAVLLGYGIDPSALVL